MIEAISLLLAIIGIVFAFEPPRKKFAGLFKHSPLKDSPHSDKTPDITENNQLPEVSIYGATQSGRYPFFIREPFETLTAAQNEARISDKLIFLVIYDEDHPSKSQLFYSLGCFLDYFTTKKLVDDFFVSALVPVTSSGVRQLVPEDDPLENALWVVLEPNGEILRREGVYANPDEGLKRVRSVIADFTHVE